MSPWQLLRAHQSSRTALGYHLQHGAAGTVHYSTAPAPPAGHCEVTGGLSPSSGKQTMQQLNMRLASYLQQVEFLSVTNQRLEHEIQEELRKRCPTDVKELDQLLRSASFLQEQIMDCLSARAQLNLQLLAAELAIFDLNTRSEQEHQQRSRVEAENSDLRYLHEVLNVHKLPELQEVLREQGQELQELQERHLQDEQALLNQVSGGVSVAMQTAESSELIQQLDMLRRISAESWTEVCSVQEPILQAPDVTSDLAESPEVAELEHLRMTSAHLTEDLKHLQRENAMLETSGRQQTENFVVELTVLQETADRLCLDLDSVLQAADQQAADHEVLLDVKSRLEAEIQDYMRLLDSPSHQRASVLHLTSQPAVSCFTIRRGNVAVNTLEAVRGGNMSSNLVQMFSSPAGHNVRPKKTAIISSNVSNQSYSFQSALSRTGWDSSSHKNLTSQQNSSSVQSQAKESDKQASVRASEPQTSSTLLSDTKPSQTFDPPSKQQNSNFTKVEVEQIVSHEGPKLTKRLDLVTHKSTINADKHSAADMKKETKTVISASIESFSQANNNNLRQDASQESETPQEVVRDEGKVFPASVKLSEVSDELNRLDDKDTRAQDGNVGVETGVTLSSSQSPAVTDATESKPSMADSVQENGGHSESPTERVESLKVDVNRVEVIDESRVVKVDPPKGITESAAEVNFKTSAAVTTSGMSSIPQSLRNEHINVVISPESVQTSDRSLLKSDESLSETVKKIPAEDKETVEKIPAEDNETVEKIPAEDKETVEKIPAEDKETVKTIPAEDINETAKKIPAEDINETAKKIPAEDNETVQMILGKDNEAVKKIPAQEDNETLKNIPAEDKETLEKIPAEDKETVKMIPAEEDNETVKTILAEDNETVKTILLEDNETVKKIPAEDNETIKNIRAEGNEMLKNIPAEDKETVKTIPAEEDNDTVETILAEDNQTVEKSLAENNEIVKKIQAEEEKDTVKMIPVEDKETVKTIPVGEDKETVKKIPTEDKETVKTIPVGEDKETVKTILAEDKETVKKIPTEDKETVKTILAEGNETAEKIPAKDKETVKTILAEDNETVKKTPAVDKETVKMIPAEEDKETVKTILAEDNETVKTILVEDNETVEKIPAEDNETIKKIRAEGNEMLKNIPAEDNQTVEKSLAENNEIVKKIQAEEEKDTVKMIPVEDKETVKTIPAEEDKETVKTILAEENETVEKIPAKDKETVKTILAEDNETVKKIPAVDKETVKKIPAEDKETVKTILAEDNETAKKIPAENKETVKTILAEDNETVKKIPTEDKETVKTIPVGEDKGTVKTILAEDKETVKKIPIEDKETVKTILAEGNETAEKIPAKDKETVKTILAEDNETVKKTPAVDKETVKMIPAEEDKETVKTILTEDKETVKKIPAEDKETVKTILAEEDNETVKKIPAEDKETVKTILAEENETAEKIPAKDKETVKTILAEDKETVKKIPAEDKETVMTILVEEDKETVKTILAEDKETVKTILAEEDNETVKKIPAEDKETVKTILVEEDKETVKTILAEDKETVKKIPAEDKETVTTILAEEHSETVDPSEQTVSINMKDSKMSSSTSDSGVILTPAESLTLTETHFSPPADGQPWIDNKNVERQGKREEEETGSDLVVDCLEQSQTVNKEKLLENEDTSVGSDSKENQSAGSDNVKVKVEEEEQPSDSRDPFTDSAETDKELVELSAQQESKGLASNSDSGVTLSLSSKENNLSPKELVISENQAVRLETSLSPADVLTSPNDPTLFRVDPNDNVMSLDRPKDLEMFLGPSDPETCLSPMEVLPEDDDNDDDDDACLTEANALVRPVEKYILSTKDEDNIVPEIDKRTNTAREDKFKVFEESKVTPNVLKRPISQEGSLKKASSGGVLESGGSNIQSIIADKEKQLGFEGLYRRPVRTAGRSLEEYKSEGDIATRAIVPAGRISTSRASDVTAGGVKKGSGEWIAYGNNLRQSNEITSVGSPLSTSQPRPGRFGSGEWIVYGSDRQRKSSLDGVGTSVNEGNDESISRFGTSAPETRRFGRRSSGGTDEWIVYGGGVGHKSNAGSTQTQSVEHLRPMSPPETGRFARRSSGGSDEWIVYGGGIGHKNNEGLTQTQITERLRPMSPPETGRFARRNSSDWIVYGGTGGRPAGSNNSRRPEENDHLTAAMQLSLSPPGSVGAASQQPLSPPGSVGAAPQLPLSPPGSTRFGDGSGEWRVYGGSGRLSGPPSSEWRVISPPGSYTARGPRVSNTGGRLSSGGAMKRSSSLGSGGRLHSPVGNQRIGGSMDTKPVYSSAGGHRSSSAGPGQPGQPGGASQSAQSPAGKSFNASPRVPGGWLHSAAAAAHRTSSTGSGSRSSTGGSGNERISGAAGGRVSGSSGSGRVNSTGGRVITSSDRPIRSTGSGSGSHKERISVCKMAALLMSAAGRERSKDKQKKKQQQQQQQQQQATAASPLLQRWLTTGVGVTSDDVENPDDIMNL